MKAAVRLLLLRDRPHACIPDSLYPICGNAFLRRACPTFEQTLAVGVRLTSLFGISADALGYFTVHPCLSPLTTLATKVRLRPQPKGSA